LDSQFGGERAHGDAVDAGLVKQTQSGSRDHSSVEFLSHLNSLTLFE
jgi:hypothetical protein